MFSVACLCISVYRRNWVPIQGPSISPLSAPVLHRLAFRILHSDIFKLVHLGPHSSHTDPLPLYPVHLSASDLLALNWHALLFPLHFCYSVASENIFIWVHLCFKTFQYKKTLRLMIFHKALQESRNWYCFFSAEIKVVKLLIRQNRAFQYFCG